MNFQILNPPLDLSCHIFHNFIIKIVKHSMLILNDTVNISLIVLGLILNVSDLLTAKPYVIYKNYFGGSIKNLWF